MRRVQKSWEALASKAVASKLRTMKAERGSANGFSVHRSPFIVSKLTDFFSILLD